MIILAYCAKIEVGFDKVFGGTHRKRVKKTVFMPIIER
jgi:hypothetical protein